jgi:hypothetical protein
MPLCGARLAGRLRGPPPLSEQGQDKGHHEEPDKIGGALLPVRPEDRLFLVRDVRSVFLRL